MFEYIQKFNGLPDDVREKVSGNEAMGILEEIEQKYGVELAATIMRVMVDEIPLIDLPKFFTFEYNFDGATAQQLADELTEKVFSRAAEYLGLSVERGISIDQVEIKDEPENFVPKAQGSTFFFSPEDEEEVRELTSKLITGKEKVYAEEDTQKKLDQVIAMSGIMFSSEIIKDRFKNVIKTYIRNVRNKIDAREALMRAVNSGGVGLDEKTADKALSAADSFKKNDTLKTITPPPAVALPEDKLVAKKTELSEKKSDATSESMEKLKASGMRDVDYDLSALKKPAQDNKPIVQKKIDIVGNTVFSEQVDDNKNGKEPENKSFFTLKRSSKPVGRTGKVKVEDVKFVPKLTGPIEELKNMDIVNFRRLAQDPMAIAQKIKEKIKYLEDEQYSKRAEGVKAWRQSPINQLYLAIGRESMESAKSIDEVLKDRAMEGKEFLSNAEFEAIMDLNRQLRY